MNGAYDLEGILWHQISNRLIIKILELWPDKATKVMDLGCGINYYITCFRAAGYRQTFGIDAVDLGSKYAFQEDLTKPLTVYKKANVISLETGEHIPSEFSGVYLDNVCAYGGDVILSWAVPGQAGHGHINCKDNQWVRDQMAERGYSFDKRRTDELRTAVQYCHCTWFVRTLMYFHFIPEA